MKQFIKAALVTNLILAFICLATSCTPAAENNLTSSETMNAFRATLEKDGFTFKSVPFLPVDLVKLYEAGRLPSVAGNNFGAPYKGVFGALPGNMEITDESQLTNAQEQIDNWLYSSSGLIKGWQLNPDEAIVLITKTPPECAYFSYCGFIFYKYYEKDQASKWVWTSFNDPLNNLTIKTSGTPNGEAGNPYDQDTVIILTADKNTDQRIRNALVATGYPEDIINTYVIPSSMVKLGIGTDCDTIVFGHRMALFTDEEKGEAYRNKISLAYRVTPTSQGELDSFPAPVLRVRGTGQTEVDFQPALDELRQAILTKYNQLDTEEIETSVWLTESYDAVQRGVFVAGESRDTVYLRSDSFTLGDDPNECVIVYGVNHAASGKATYANLSFYGEALWNGVAGIYNIEYEGSAEAYLPGNPMAKYLYVCKFTRIQSSESYCIVVPTGPGAQGVGLGELAFIGFRAYLEPATKVGPAFVELLYDRVIKFSPKK
ncbi:MAG: hypothetical protein PHG35_01110 [Dehalococcoidales bacterium]|nr:hypothetical protein [Dehalococcoidales bacterium]